ncbi:MAG: thioredoxin family protein [Chitinophagaceae bacterium]
MYNKHIIYIFLLAFAACTAANKATYTTQIEGTSKIIIGPFKRNLLETDSVFQWFSTQLKYGRPNADAVTILQNQANGISFIVFGGTWCEDTRQLLPVFFRWIDAAGFDNQKIQLWGVDRNKQSTNKAHEKYQIKNVPTFIVLKNGKEIGRVVEYGSIGVIDKELATIIANAAK